MRQGLFPTAEAALGEASGGRCCGSPSGTQGAPATTRETKGCFSRELLSPGCAAGDIRGLLCAGPDVRLKLTGHHSEGARTQAWGAPNPLGLGHFPAASRGSPVVPHPRACLPALSLPTHFFPRFLSPWHPPLTSLPPASGSLIRLPWAHSRHLLVASSLPQGSCPSRGARPEPQFLPSAGSTRPDW